MFGSIHLALLVAVCIIGQTIGQACDFGCLTCDPSNPSFCTQCDTANGFYLDDNNVCQVCTGDCATCSTATQCSSCSNTVGVAPDSTGQATCSPCASNCASCVQRGPAKCDDSGCTEGWALNDTTYLCEPCSGVKCPGCITPHTCPTCVDGMGLDPMNGSLPPVGCKNCAVPHAKTCTANYQTMLYCQYDYAANYTDNTCDPICATIPKSEWGGIPGSKCAKPLIHQVLYIIIHHSLTVRCENQTKCSNVIRSMQKSQLAPKNSDNLGGGQTEMQYHYIIGDDGQIYDGRNTTCCGMTYDAKSAKYNCRSYDVCFLGNFKMVHPSDKAIEALIRLVSNSTTNKYNTSCVDNKHSDLSPNWKLVTHSDVGCTTCPGGNFTKTLSRIFGAGDPKYASQKLSGRYTRQQYCTSGKTDTHPVK